MLQQKFFDAEILQQSLELAESLDRFHFFLNANHLEQAKHEIYKIAENDQRPFIYRNMYWLETKRNSEEGKVSAARKLVECEPSTDHLFLLASSLTSVGNDREALDVYHQIIDQMSEPSWQMYTVYKNIGNLYLKAKDFEAAEEYFHRAFTINAEDLNLLVSYGYLYLHSGKLEESKSRFAEVLIKDDEYLEAYIGLALVHSTVGEFDLACANLSQVLDRNPSHKLALYLHFNWAENLASCESTIELINRYLEENPSDEEALTLKVGWYIKKQNFKKAYDSLPVLRKNFSGNSRHIAQLENYLRETL